MNRSNRLVSAVALTLAATLVSAPAGAWMNKEEKAWVERLENRVNDLERRLQRAERLIESSNLQKMYIEQERMDNTLRSLQGQLEELQYKLQQMDKNQREIFLDFDQRLQQMQAAPSAGGFQSSSSVATDEEGDEGADAAGDSTPGFDEASQYKAAFDYLKSRNFPQAIEAFKSFLQQWPSSSLTGNAQYWLGEAYYGNRDYANAAKEFGKVRSLYPDSRKVPDATLKQGYSYYALKQWKKARKVLEEIRQAYPDSRVAGLAADRLKRMKLEGH